MAEEEKKAPIELTEQQKKEAEEAFKVFDKDKDGFISPEELSAVLRSLGQNPSKQEINELFSTLDKNKDLSISFDEFLKLWQTQLNDEDSEEYIIDAFKVFDKEQEEKILATELAHILKGIGDPMSQEDIDELIATAQPDAQGYISYPDFVRRIMNS